VIHNETKIFNSTVTGLIDITYFWHKYVYQTMR